MFQSHLIRTREKCEKSWQRSARRPRCVDCRGIEACHNAEAEQPYPSIPTIWTWPRIVTGLGVHLRLRQEDTSREIAVCDITALEYVERAASEYPQVDLLYFWATANEAHPDSGKHSTLRTKAVHGRITPTCHGNKRVTLHQHGSRHPRAYQRVPHRAPSKRPTARKFIKCYVNRYRNQHPHILPSCQHHHRRHLPAPIIKPHQQNQTARQKLLSS